MRWSGVFLLFLVVSLLAAADQPRVNPYAGQPLDIQAGAKLYRRYCAACHAAGDKAPPLTSGAVRGMSSEELFRLLKNGRLAQGMPSWAQLPPEQRWQIVAWLKAAE
jgi:mono/diheme cytochrome c family protein